VYIEHDNGGLVLANYLKKHILTVADIVWPVELCKSDRDTTV
jgi:hypothetical protein